MNFGSSTPKILDAQGTWIVQLVFQMTNVSFGTYRRLIQINDGGSNQVDLRIFGGVGHELRVTRNGTTLAETSGLNMAANTWYYIEFKVVIHNSTGSFEVRLNGVSKLSGSNVDTQNTGNATADRIELCGSNDGPNVDTYIDDLIIMDGTGSVNNAFLGDYGVKIIRPDGAGNYSQWTPSAGSNYQNVDETLVDDDTTYNSSGTAAQKDSYTFSAVGETGGVAGIILLATMRKDDAGSRTARQLTRVASTDYFGATESVLDSFQVHKQVQETNPNTAAAWTVSEIDGAEFGVELVS
jgi:hypothetical protein